MNTVGQLRSSSMRSITCRGLSYPEPAQMAAEERITYSTCHTARKESSMIFPLIMH